MEDLYRSDGTPKRQIGRLGTAALEGRSRCGTHGRPGRRREGVPVIIDDLFDLVSYRIHPEAAHPTEPGRLPGCTHRACTFACPARCYTWSEERHGWSSPTRPAWSAAPASPLRPGALDWHYPQGGYGVRFRLT